MITLKYNRTGCVWNVPRNGLGISMEGMWKVDVTATRRMITLAFNVDAR